MSKQLRISRDLALPGDVAGEAIAVVAKRGAGKTTTGRVIAEELHAAKVPFCVLDPVGAWWGLRSSADGKGEGLPVPILGGPYGDVPLEASAGALLADVVVDSGQSLVLDLTDFSKTQQRHFVTDFAERLYQRKGRDRSLLHLILEETAEFAPQIVRAGDARMFGAIDSIVRLGRGRGIGVTMITQRTAALNKAVLEEADVLIAMRTMGKRAREAVEGWISHQELEGGGDDKDVIRSLAGLQDGEAWIWNPQRGILKRVQIRRGRTYDSGQGGGQGTAPKKTAPIDLDALGEKIAATAEKAKENDPAELRKKISALERDLAKRPTETKVEVETVVERVEVQVPVFNGEVDKLADAVSALRTAAAQIGTAAEWVSKAVAGAHQLAATRPRDVAPPRPRAESAPRTEVVPRTPVKPPPSRPAPPAADVDASGLQLGKGELTVLGVLAEFPDGRTQNELAFLAGYSAKASTIGVILAKLRRAGLVEPGAPIRATPAGFEAVGGIRERPTGQALLEHWLRHPRMGEGERKVLLELIAWYPNAPSHDELCERTGYSPLASTMGVILSKLRKLSLVEKGVRRPAPEFMEAIREG